MSLYRARTPVCSLFVWSEIFTSSPYRLRIKIPFLFILFVQGFVVGERWAYFHMHRKLTHKNAGLLHALAGFSSDADL